MSSRPPGIASGDTGEQVLCAIDSAGLSDQRHPNRKSWAIESTTSEARAPCRAQLPLDDADDPRAAAEPIDDRSTDGVAAEVKIRGLFIHNRNTAPDRGLCELRQINQREAHEVEIGSATRC